MPAKAMSVNPNRSCRAASAGTTSSGSALCTVKTLSAFWMTKTRSATLPAACLVKVITCCSALCLSLASICPMSPMDAATATISSAMATRANEESRL